MNSWPRFAAEQIQAWSDEEGFAFPDALRSVSDQRGRSILAHEKKTIADTVCCLIKNGQKERAVWNSGA